MVRRELKSIFSLLSVCVILDHLVNILSYFDDIKKGIKISSVEGDCEDCVS